MRRSRPTALVLLAAALTVLTACSSPAPAVPVAADASAAPAPASVDAVPAGLTRFYTQKLTWGPCASFAGPDDKAAFAEKRYDCTRLEVPLDYADPARPTAQLGVLRLKATGDKIGSLVVNPGGPGASGMSAVPSLFGSGEGAEGPLTKRFDVVGLDPRGVGASTPTIDCLTDAEWEVERGDLDVDPSPAGVAQTEEENRQYAQRCTDRVGAAVLANVGTRDAARDLDVLRAAVGDQKLTYLGYSYGTRLGSTYAEDFPQNVRALVLDGALDPSQTTVERSVAQAAGFQQAFDAFAAECAKQGDCPLGADPAKATAAFQAITRPLVDRPLAVGPRKLTYPDAITGVTQALYVSSAWPALAQGISALAKGDGTILMLLADLYLDRRADGSYGNAIEAFDVISCVDEQRITDPAAIADGAARELAAAPYRDAGRGVVAARDKCAFWPVPPTSTPHTPNVAGLPPTVVVSTTGDPATPYAAGVDLAKALGGTLLRVEGEQHGAVLSGSACVDDAVSAYLVDLTVPASGTACRLAP
ncbi:alpha/beta hydrolase [Pseudonocardia charpentierae]|uniref:Alpha/beta hydrolase n=1 Tax=Pseudonocardia charpentierae TaxID=3075545 RepID=A0ABU2N7G6_9PSEU|nr:alpha/beta hydrolase [Pseudonocardia sp. DSM 45834]MDT0349890.1 alpha/beta hydrolase [Pseudonocardia sp. DSM 45834]